jgi:hypothetical protein
VEGGNGIHVGLFGCFGCFVCFVVCFVVCCLLFAVVVVCWLGNDTDFCKKSISIFPSLTDQNTANTAYGFSPLQTTNVLVL